MSYPCRVKGPQVTFHLVWTVSWQEKGNGHASSEDLIHWSKQKYIPVSEHESKDQNYWSQHCFVIKDRRDF